MFIISVTVDPYISSLASMVSSQTGLDPKVVLSQWQAEQGIQNTSQWYSNNPAGITHGNSKVDALSIGVNSHGFDIFPNAYTGAVAYATLLNTDPSYSSIRATAGKDPQSQLQAIVSSPWDAGHYGGDGSKLFNVYNSISGQNLVSSGILPTTTSATLTDGGSGLNILGGVQTTVYTSLIYIILVALLIFSLYVTFVK